MLQTRLPVNLEKALTILVIRGPLLLRLGGAGIVRNIIIDIIKVSVVLAESLKVFLLRAPSQDSALGSNSNRGLNTVSAF